MAASVACTEETRKVADQFTRALDQNQFDQAYALIAPSADGMTSLAAFKSRFATRRAKLGGGPLYTEYQARRYRYTDPKQLRLQKLYERKHVGAQEFVRGRARSCRHSYWLEYPQLPVYEHVLVAPTNGRLLVASFQDG